MADSSGITRRSLFAGAGCAAAMVALGGVRYLGSEPVTRPPGGQDEDLLLAGCIRCGKCMEACSQKVIRPVHAEKGLVGMRTPTMDFSEGWCDWCEGENGGVPLCASTCPTGALALPASATPEGTILGKAHLDEDQCLAYRLIGCRFCFDACPYDAIALDPHNRPVVDEERCNGCGACECVCVSQQEASLAANSTRRAISVYPADDLPKGR